MRFTLTFVPGLAAAAFLWHEVTACYPYKVTAPQIDGAAGLAFVCALAAVLVVSFLAATRSGWAWPVVSAAAGTTPFIIPLLRAHYLAATLPTFVDSEFHWQTSAPALDHLVLATLAVCLGLGVLLGAVLRLPPLRR